MATAYNWNGMVGGEEFPHGLPARRGEQRDARVEARRPTLTELKMRVATPARTTAGKHKPEIVEFYTVKRIDNSRLVRHVEPVKLRNFYKTAALGGIVAVFFMFYIYQHFRCIDLSFQLEDLKGKQMQAAALNSELKLEISALRDPHRIDVIAQHELGLKRPEPTQVREYANLDGAQVAAAQFTRINRVP
jgi:cell division protein FtsL